MISARLLQYGHWNMWSIDRDVARSSDRDPVVGRSQDTQNGDVLICSIDCLSVSINGALTSAAAKRGK
jgi:hypothetical protein